MAAVSQTSGLALPSPADFAASSLPFLEIRLLARECMKDQTVKKILSMEHMRLQPSSVILRYKLRSEAVKKRHSILCLRLLPSVIVHLLAGTYTEEQLLIKLCKPRDGEHESRVRRSCGVDPGDATMSWPSW